MDLGFRRSPQLEDLVPRAWYNILPDLPEPLPPMLKPSDLEVLFPRALVEQEFSLERFVAIPDELRDLSSQASLEPPPIVKLTKICCRGWDSLRPLTVDEVLDLIMR